MRTQVEETIDHIEYDNFLKNSKEATFYHTSKHLLFLGDMIGLTPKFITARENDKLTGAMPFFVKESIHGKVINSLPFFGSYGGVVSENTETQKAILHQINIFNKENDVLSATIIVTPFTKNNDIYEKYYQFNIQENRLVQCLLLQNKTEDDIWQQFEQRVRRAVRKSIRYEVQIKKPDLDDSVMANFYLMHKKDMETKGGKPKPPEFFKMLKKNFIQTEDYDIFLASRNDQEIAYLLAFYFHSFTEYYMPAYNSELKHLQATSLLIWESIKSSISKKILYYNFGGTWKNQPELYLYKRGWNASDFPYNYYIYGDIERAKCIGLDEIKNAYQNFYVFPYDVLKQN